MFTRLRTKTVHQTKRINYIISKYSTSTQTHTHTNQCVQRAQLTTEKRNKKKKEIERYNELNGSREGHRCAMLVLLYYICRKDFWIDGIVIAYHKTINNDFSMRTVHSAQMYVVGIAVPTNNICDIIWLYALLMELTVP